MWYDQDSCRRDDLAVLLIVLQDWLSAIAIDLERQSSSQHHLADAPMDHAQSQANTYSHSSHPAI
jgi:hypothetical protein